MSDIKKYITNLISWIDNDIIFLFYDTKSIEFEFQMNSSNIKSKTSINLNIVCQYLTTVIESLQNEPYDVSSMNFLMKYLSLYVEIFIYRKSLKEEEYFIANVLKAISKFLAKSSIQMIIEFVELRNFLFQGNFLNKWKFINPEKLKITKQSKIIINNFFYDYGQPFQLGVNESNESIWFWPDEWDKKIGQYDCIGFALRIFTSSTWKLGIIHSYDNISNLYSIRLESSEVIKVDLYKTPHSWEVAKDNIFLLSETRGFLKYLTFSKRDLGTFIRIFWSKNNTFFYGRIQQYNEDTKSHSVLYQDGDIREYDFSKMALTDFEVIDLSTLNYKTKYKTLEQFYDSISKFTDDQVLESIKLVTELISNHGHPIESFISRPRDISSKLSCHWMNCINTFLSSNGFDSIIQVLSNHSSIASTKLLFLHVKLVTIFKLSNILPIAKLRDMIWDLKELVSFTLSAYTDQYMKDFVYSEFQDILLTLRELIVSIATSEIVIFDECCEELRLLIAFKCITCSQIQKRLLGLTIIKDIINIISPKMSNYVEERLVYLHNTKNGRFAHPVNDHHPKKTNTNNNTNTIRTMNKISKLSISQEYLLKWLLRYEVLEQVFGSLIHHGLLSQFDIILTFMAFNNTLNENHLKLIWKACTNAHEALIKVIHSLIILIVPIMENSLRNSFFLYISNLAIDEFNESSLIFFKTYTVQSMLTNENTATSSMKSPSKKGRIVNMSMKMLMGFGLLWNFIQTNPLDIQLLNLAIDLVVELLQIEFPEERDRVIQKCLEYIRLDKATTTSFRLLRHILQSHVSGNTTSNSFEILKKKTLVDSNALKPLKLLFKEEKILDLVFIDLSRFLQDETNTKTNGIGNGIGNGNGIGIGNGNGNGIGNTNTNASTNRRTDLMNVELLERFYFLKFLITSSLLFSTSISSMFIQLQFHHLEILWKVCSSCSNSNSSNGISKLESLQTFMEFLDYFMEIDNDRMVLLICHFNQETNPYQSTKTNTCERSLLFHLFTSNSNVNDKELEVIRQMKSSQSTKRCFMEESIEKLFDLYLVEYFTNSNHLDIISYQKIAFVCMRLFLYVNINRKTLVIDLQGDWSRNGPLTGLTLLWKLAIDVKDSLISNTASALIVELHHRYSTKYSSSELASCYFMRLCFIQLSTCVQSLSLEDNRFESKEQQENKANEVLTSSLIPKDGILVYKNPSKLPDTSSLVIANGNDDWFHDENVILSTSLLYHRIHKIISIMQMFSIRFTSCIEMLYTIRIYIGKDISSNTFVTSFTFHANDKFEMLRQQVCDYYNESKDSILLINMSSNVILEDDITNIAFKDSLLDRVINILVKKKDTTNQVIPNHHVDLIRPSDLIVELTTNESQMYLSSHHLINHHKLAISNNTTTTTFLIDYLHKAPYHFDQLLQILDGFLYSQSRQVVDNQYDLQDNIWQLIQSWPWQVEMFQQIKNIPTNLISLPRLFDILSPYRLYYSLQLVEDLLNGNSKNAKDQEFVITWIQYFLSIEGIEYLLHIANEMIGCFPCTSISDHVIHIRIRIIAIICQILNHILDYDPMVSKLKSLVTSKTKEMTNEMPLGIIISCIDCKTWIPKLLDFFYHLTSYSYDTSSSIPLDDFLFIGQSLVPFVFQLVIVIDNSLDILQSYSLTFKKWIQCVFIEMKNRKIRELCCFEYLEMIKQLFSILNINTSLDDNEVEVYLLKLSFLCQLIIDLCVVTTNTSTNKDMSNQLESLFHLFASILSLVNHSNSLFILSFIDLVHQNFEKLENGFYLMLSSYEAKEIFHSKEIDLTLVSIFHVLLHLYSNTYTNTNTSNTNGNGNGTTNGNSNSNTSNGNGIGNGNGNGIGIGNGNGNGNGNTNGNTNGKAIANTNTSSKGNATSNSNKMESFIELLINKCLFSSTNMSLCQHESTRRIGYSLLFHLVTLQPINTTITSCSKNFSLMSKLMKQLKLPNTKTTLQWQYDPNSYLKKDNTFVGLVNQGSTCYLNAFIQQLVHIPIFSNAIMELNHSKQSNTSNSNEREMLFQLQILFAYLRFSNKKYCNTLDFCHAFKDYNGSSLSLTEQKDINEFATMLFDQLEQSHPQCKSILSNSIQGQVIWKTKSLESSYESNRQEDFYMITLEVKDKSNILDSLDVFIEEETFVGDNKIEDPISQRKVDATRKCVIKQLPNTLILHLKRFEFDLSTLERHKLNDYFSFPMTLDMFPYTEDGSYMSSSSSSLNEEKNESKMNHNRQDYIYQLVGVVAHVGSIDRGHYYSYIKERQSQQWFEFNDRAVLPFNIESLESCCFGGQVITKQANGSTMTMMRDNNAYLLVYEKQSLSPKDIPWSHTSIDTQVVQTVQRENISFHIDQNLYSTNHFQFMWHIAHSNILDDMLQQKQDISDMVLVILKFIIEVVATSKAQSCLPLYFERLIFLIRHDESIQDYVSYAILNELVLNPIYEVVLGNGLHLLPDALHEERKVVDSLQGNDSNVLNLKKSFQSRDFISSRCHPWLIHMFMYCQSSTCIRLFAKLLIQVIKKIHLKEREEYMKSLKLIDDKVVVDISSEQRQQLDLVTLRDDDMKSIKGSGITKLVNKLLVICENIPIEDIQGKEGIYMIGTVLYSITRHGYDECVMMLKMQCIVRLVCSLLSCNVANKKLPSLQLSCIINTISQLVRTAAIPPLDDADSISCDECVPSHLLTYESQERLKHKLHIPVLQRTDIQAFLNRIFLVDALRINAPDTSKALLHICLSRGGRDLIRVFEFLIERIEDCIHESNGVSQEYKSYFIVVDDLCQLAKGENLKNIFIALIPPLLQKTEYVVTRNTSNDMEFAYDMLKLLYAVGLKNPKAIPYLQQVRSFYKSIHIQIGKTKTKSDSFITNTMKNTDSYGIPLSNENKNISYDLEKANKELFDHLNLLSSLTS